MRKLKREKIEIVHLGIRIEKDVLEELKTFLPIPFGTTSNLVRNILKDWLKKNSKKSFDNVKQ
jgi:hypothetical protein